MKYKLDFVGNSSDKSREDIYLDSAATGLALASSKLAADRFLEYYANVHTTVHKRAKISEECFQWASWRIKSFLGALENYEVLFAGSGATACLNIFARMMRDARPKQDTVIISAMEHHSNDLPHRAAFNNIIFCPLVEAGVATNILNFSRLEELLNEHRGRVSYVAVTGLSNVTGARVDIQRVSDLCHGAGVSLLVDGAQLTPRARVEMAKLEIDALVFSGHKMYSPGSPGVLLVRRNLLQTLPSVEFGGGMVEDVTFSGFTLHSDLQSRFHAGTPNIFGAIHLAYTIHELSQIGIDLIAQHEIEICAEAWNVLSNIDGVTCYGARSNEAGPSMGCISFNIAGLPHSIVGQALHDLYGISVRTGCFCAHPYVRLLMEEQFLEMDLNPDDPASSERIKSMRGMVRASFGPYTTMAHIQALGNAVRKIAEVANESALKANLREARSDQSSIDPLFFLSSQQ